MTEIPRPQHLEVALAPPDSAARDPLPQDSRQARQFLRRQSITETVMAEGAVRIEDLAERFEISLMTAHRDLDELASRGILRKTRGIAQAAPTSLIESSDLYRANRQSAEWSAQIVSEDIDIILGVQRNLNAGVYQRGPVSPKYEHGVLGFQNMVRDALADPAPEAQRVAAE